MFEQIILAVFILEVTYTMIYSKASTSIVILTPVLTVAIDWVLIWS